MVCDGRAWRQLAALAAGGCDSTPLGAVSGALAVAALLRERPGLAWPPVSWAPQVPDRSCTGSPGIPSKNVRNLVQGLGNSVGPAVYGGHVN